MFPCEPIICGPKLGKHGIMLFTPSIRYLGGGDHVTLVGRSALKLLVERIKMARWRRRTRTFLQELVAGTATRLTD